MKKLLITIFLCAFFYSVTANDGSYYISGNSLIPLVETRISITKEILTITRNKQDERKVDVSVYYEFYNPDEAKKLIVGFEANSPGGDVDPDPINGRHPYMSGFMAEMNGLRLNHSVAIVQDSLYYKDGKFKMLSDEEVQENTYDLGTDFMYVYHFEANFKPGKNIIKHTYTCELSGSVEATYSFDYVLTAAMRWGNRQIDDFTLIIDMGDEQLLEMPMTFFDKNDGWVVVGLGSFFHEARTNYRYFDKPVESSLFYIKKGMLIFQKKNFKANGELYFSNPICEANFYETFDMNLYQIMDPRNMIENEYLEENLKTADSLSRKALRNLPFAMRGYIFKNKELQNYYDTHMWYYPNEEYTDTKMSDLTEREQSWVQSWSE